ncbi:MAG TPA: peptidylprolyl isomerase [Polyangiaceae bacterium]|nr:peptidylprolyl isomerase [Polyangiaceae bacterium]
MAPRLGAGTVMRVRSGAAGRARALLCVLAVSACRAHPGSDANAVSSASAPASASTAKAQVERRIAALVSAEERRASRDIDANDLENHDVLLRRAAARALARIADDRSGELLSQSLGDDDAEVVTWSAYGLGETCEGRADVRARALTLRAASLLFRRATDRTAALDAPSPLFDPLSSIAFALGRCGGADAEHTLRAWLALGKPLPEAAGWALGAIAARDDRLEDATLVALLDAASSRDKPVASAFQAFTRLSHLDDAVRARLLDVARAALAGSGLRRALAVRALAAAGDGGAKDLAGVVAAASATPSERADAARGLGRLGNVGQRALADALLAWVEDPAATSDARLLDASYGVLATLLGALEPPPDRAGPALSRLAKLDVHGPPALARRLVALRCGAASLLAGRGSESAALAACDPDPNGRSGRLARLKVLDRGPLQGKRLAAWQLLANANDGVVREHALELLAKHDELDGTATLARALASKLGGEVATAAHLVAEHPERASPTGAADAPAPAVTRALTAALEHWDASPLVEVKTNLADAAGRLGLLTVKARLESACKSANPTLRQHAERALHQLGDRERRCTTFEPPSAAPAELAHPRTAPVRIELETDTGTFDLELDPALAPTAVTRLAELATAHFFDGVVVHRVVPGFVVQLGDPDGDGYGGAQRPPLRCETSPAPFETGSVGIALSGRDTGSSQFFVTLGREAHLDGAYALVGHAGAGWDRLAEGDIVQTIHVK